MYGELYPMDEDENIYEIDCDVCEMITEVVVDSYQTQEVPGFCPMCGSHVTIGE